MKLFYTLALVLVGLAPAAAHGQTYCPVTASGPDPVMRAGASNQRITVPVYFHVITGGRLWICY